ncbi:uncharacterized protein LOC127250156 [Andrographis paniculata]|uniref:uncharacterized protein LOC127250156 n=1 Tax=Andrographis paniculata TaxID=175694 RepID=UPI0021E8A128|nr:uncharacterized protein LOC127250156 [Andrographis paniculata]
MEECVTFCSRYLGDIETKENRAARGEEDGTQHGKGLFGSRFNLDYNTMHQIHCYILGNIDEISPLRRIHLDTIRSCRTRAPPREVHQQHNEQFASWFQSYVDDPTNNDECPISAEIRALAGGPLCNATRYSSCIVSGIRYRVQDRDARKRTQCAGVMVTADTVSYASARDHNPREGSVAYYGILTDIVEVYYSNQQKYLLLKCDWVDLERGVKEDEFKYKCVNFKYLMYPKNLPTDEPFILATQASQVWYIADPVDEGWSVVVPVSRRDTYEGSLLSTSLSPCVQSYLFAIEHNDKAIRTSNQNLIRVFYDDHSRILVVIFPTPQTCLDTVLVLSCDPPGLHCWLKLLIWLIGST